MAYEYSNFGENHILRNPNVKKIALTDEDDEKCWEHADSHPMGFYENTPTNRKYLQKNDIMGWIYREIIRDFNELDTELQKIVEKKFNDRFNILISPSPDKIGEYDFIGVEDKDNVLYSLKTVNMDTTIGVTRDNTKLVYKTYDCKTSFAQTVLHIAYLIKDGDKTFKFNAVHYNY